MDYAILLAGLALGPLLLIRVRHLPPAPGGVVVSPTAPKLDLAVVVDADASDPALRPLVASLTGQRPQPAHVVIEPGAQAPVGVGAVVTMKPDVVLSSPEALDRIAAQLEAYPVIAIYPWQKTTERTEAVAMFPVLVEAMGLATPTAVVAHRTATSNDAVPRTYFGGHIVAQRAYRETHEHGSFLTTFLAVLYCASGVGAAALLVAVPNWAHFGLYAAYVSSISVCLRQVGRFARFATIVYPVTLLAFVVAALRRNLAGDG